jgi:hypothetical protein
MCAGPAETSREYYGGDACTLKKAALLFAETGMLNII